MDILIFKILALLSLTIFFIPKKFNYLIFLVLAVFSISLTTFWSLETFSGNLKNLYFFTIVNLPVNFVFDKLSAFFILIINLTTFTAVIYSKNYLLKYYDSKNNTEISLHFFSFYWLYLSMILVVLIRNVIAFLTVWEIMSLASFMLVLFESEKKETVKTALNYFIQMHIGLVFILTAFLIAYISSEGEFSFDGLAVYFSEHKPLPLFILFFIGFGIKAGFIPMHSWLPYAHPAAPSHVSAVMSGVMIKMGIYGILRVISNIHTDLMTIGFFILAFSVLSGFMGILNAAYQKDFKKLLAYCSIENIGIIGIGIGTGLIGIATNLPALAALGFAGGLLHILNHSLFKSLLFYSAGSIYLQTHTRNIEQLGGLVKKMPKTAAIFLIGSIAISGLPPFNGFISEFLIYSGLFKSLHSAELTTNILILISIIALTVIGGLAIFSFTKLFSITFLGSPRSEKINNVTEVKNLMLIPQYLIIAIIIFIGFAPSIIIPKLSEITEIFTGQNNINFYISPVLNNISLSFGIFLFLVIILWILRSIQHKKNTVKTDATWGCGYTGANPATHQYTGSSYSDSLSDMTRLLVNNKKDFQRISRDEIFPTERNFESKTEDIFEKNIINKPTGWLMTFFEKIAIFQTGRIQHYLLYALIFIIIISIISILNLI